MGYVELMKVVCLELVVEYLVMVVMLVEIKLCMLLLCLVEVEEEEEDLWVELICCLQEYEWFKKVVEDFDELFWVGCDVLVLVVVVFQVWVCKLLLELVLQELMLVMGEMLCCVDLFESYQVICEVLFICECMSEVLECLKGGVFVFFIQLFILEEGKFGVVVIFMVIFELVKEQMVELVQNEVFGVIYVCLWIVCEVEEGEILEEVLEDDFE